MVFKANETVGNFKHVGLKCARLLLRRKRDHFLSVYSDYGLPVAPAIGMDGKQRFCRVCGYAMVAVELDRGWTLDTCSAMPVLLLTSPLFAAWRKRVPPERTSNEGVRLPAVAEKLPTSCS